LKAGGEPVLVASAAGPVQAFNHLDKADTFDATIATSDAAVGDFDALILPGGVANPDQLRTDPAAVGLTRAFFATGKPVAAICHGPWTLVEADVIRGRTLTSWPSLQTDIRNGGGEWVDRELVLCEAGPNLLITSRKPDDLPAFCTALVEQFAVAGAPAGR
ncbi:MAG: type 1 glutamine amidotransferase, partial [Acidimicrobiaceae bacterium]|nr:type 1 glutamine amidotransferase [Acidimicrobiaceae bacterium]